MIMLGAAVSLKTLFHLRFLIFLLMMTLNVIRFVQRKWNSGFCFPSASSATKRKQGTGNKPLCRIFQEAQVDLETQNISGSQRTQLKCNASFHTHCNAMQCIVSQFIWKIKWQKQWLAFLLQVHLAPQQLDKGAGYSDPASQTKKG